jgi:KaiC/GvpD/RAD55 family RecA-like ATPase
MKVATGTAVLDYVLGGGIEKNSKIMVYGNDGSGKTCMCCRFLHEGLEKEEQCLYITTKEDPKKIILKSKKLSLNISEHVKKGLLTFLDARRAQKETAIKKITTIIHEKDVTRTAIDTMNDVITVKSKNPHMKKYKELMKQTNKLMTTLSKSNTCMATMDAQKITSVEMRMLEDFFQTAIRLSKEKNTYYGTITKSEKKPEVQNQPFEMEEDITTYKVKKFFE